MQDAKTRRLIFLTFLPLLGFLLFSEMSISEPSRVTIEGVLAGMQLLIVLQLKLHRIQKERENQHS